MVQPGETVKLLKIAALLSLPTVSEEFPSCLCTIQYFYIDHTCILHMLYHMIYKYTVSRPFCHPLKILSKHVKAGSPPIVPHVFFPKGRWFEQQSECLGSPCGGECHIFQGRVRTGFDRKPAVESVPNGREPLFCWITL